MLIAAEAKADYGSAGLKFATSAFLSSFTNFPWGYHAYELL